MKIIIEGTPLIKQLPVWVGMIMTCPHCSTVFQLEENDNVTVTSPRSICDDNLRIRVSCPFCNYSSIFAFKNEIKKSI